ncbi:DUF7940 domain-containing protein [Nitrobacteraceae bacterium UC4446_H13]
MTKLIPDWKSKAPKFWSVRIALGGVVFWSAVGGLWVMWPAFATVLPLPVYIGAGILMSVALAVARVLKQKGLDQ